MCKEEFQGDGCDNTLASLMIGIPVMVWSMITGPFILTYWLWKKYHKKVIEHEHHREDCTCRRKAG